MIRLRSRSRCCSGAASSAGAPSWDSSLKDLAWFRPDGKEMTEEDWQKPFAHSVAFLLGGDPIATPDERGERIVGDSLLVLMNALARAGHLRPAGRRLGSGVGDARGHRRASEEKREHVAARGSVQVEGALARGPVAAGGRLISAAGSAQ